MLVCETETSGLIEVVAKFSASCEQGVVHLAREAVAACLAGDLGLPIPEPYLLDISADWATSVVDAAARKAIQASASVAFGSQWAGNQFSAWSAGAILRPGMVPAALAIFVFDAIIQNPDRRPCNPNCLIRGDNLRIFDHELALAVELSIIGWKPPWVTGSLEHFLLPGTHIFTSQLQKQNLDFSAVKESWKRITDSRQDAYAAGLPEEWAAAIPAMTQALRLIRDARDRIDACLAEVQRVLT